MVVVLAQPVPGIQSDLDSEDAFHFSNQQMKLRNGIFRVRRDGEPVLPANHELMAGSRVRTLKAKLAQAPDKFTPLTGSPPAHAGAPGSGQFLR